MIELATTIYDTLREAKDESRAGELTVLGQRLRDTFSERLGGIDVFGAEGDHSGGLLRIVADKSGIAVSFHIGGMLIYRGVEGDRICYEIVGGEGRAFKFMKHSEHEPVVEDDFFSAGFPYSECALTLSTVVEGTVALVKSDVQRTFCSDAISRVTAYSIEDVRLYGCGGKLFDATRAIFEDLISDEESDWDKIFAS